MSKFLAPIHTWLFNKIKLHEELELNLINSYTTAFGDSISDLVSKNYEDFGFPLEDKPLEDLIDTSNIHGWLQGRIKITETRCASLITNVINKFGDEAINISLNIYSQQGINSGTDALLSYGSPSAPKIYEAIGNYMLDGMPCDSANNVISKDENCIEWKTSHCLHKDYWFTGSANITFQYKLRYFWIKSFVETLNGNYSYHTTSIEGTATEPFFNKIQLKNLI